MRLWFTLWVVISVSFINFSTHAHERSEWHRVLNKARHRDPNSALSLLKDRYAALPAGAEKLYISSLIYDFMQSHQQRYYSNHTVADSPYRQSENQFIESLAAEKQRDYANAETGYLNLYQQMKAQQDTDGIFLFEYHLCRLYNEQGQYFKSQFYCELLNNKLNQSDNRLIPNYQILHAIAQNQQFVGDYQSALTSYKQLISQLPHDEDPSTIFNDIGLLLCSLGQYNKALDYLYRALTLRIKSWPPTGISQIEHSLGDVYFHMGEFNESIIHFDKARLILTPQHDPKRLAYIHLGLGRSYTELGLFHDGIHHLLHGLDYAIRYKDVLLKTEISLALSGSYLQKKYYKQAHYYATKAKTLAENSNNMRSQTLALRQLATIADQSENYQQALSYYRDYVHNEIAVRNATHRKAFEALDLSKAKLENQMMNSGLEAENEGLRINIDNLKNQRRYLISFILLLTLFSALLIRKTHAFKDNCSSDCLTSALQRAVFIRKLCELPSPANRHQHNMIILFDIDNLKSINDQFGYETGNNVLRNISSIIGTHMNRSDFWGRLGGGEFIIVLNNVDHCEVQQRVEKLHLSLTTLTSSQLQQSIPAISSSFAYLTLDASENDFNQLYPILDRALYQAKRKDKNAIVNAYNYVIEASPSSA